MLVLPGDALAGTQARLRTQVDGFAGDWQQSDLPLPVQATGADIFRGFVNLPGRGGQAFDAVAAKA